MAFTETPEGAVLSGEFDRNSPAYDQEVEQFTIRLEKIQKELHFLQFVAATVDKNDGTFEVYIIPALVDPDKEIDFEQGEEPSAVFESAEALGNTMKGVQGQKTETASPQLVAPSGGGASIKGGTGEEEHYDILTPEAGEGKSES